MTGLAAAVEIPKAADDWRPALQARLLAAHTAGDMAALVTLYAEAGENCAAEGNIDAAAFYLTHAYIYALDLGDVRADALHARLVGWGREQ